MRTVLIGLIFLSLAQRATAAITVGKKSPAFALTDLNGKVWSPEKDSKHKLLLVDFWASWCAPCLRGIPTLKKLQAAHGADGKFTVLGISMEKGGRSAVEAAAVKYSVDYPVLVGSADTAKAFGVKGFPTAVLIRDGKVLKVLSGERKLSDFETELAPFFVTP